MIAGLRRVEAFYCTYCYGRLLPAIDDRNQVMFLKFWVGGWVGEVKNKAELSSISSEIACWAELRRVGMS